MPRSLLSFSLVLSIGCASNEDPQGPSIDMLFLDKEVISDSDFIRVTAFVSDPDGLEDIVGGVLLSETGDKVYGPFVQVAGGTYEIVLSWTEIHDIEALDFVDEMSRNFIVRFSDNEGHESTQVASLGFVCENGGVMDFVQTLRQLRTVEDVETPVI